MSQALTRPPEKLEKLVHGWIGYAAKSFPIAIDEDKLARAAARLKIAVLASANPKKLMECTPDSIGKCVALSAMTELYPGAAESKPDVWLIPRAVKDKQGKVLFVALNWQMGKSSYIRLARRAGYELTPALVYKGETANLTGGTSPAIHHQIDVRGEKGWANIDWGYIIITHLASGRREILHMTKEQIAKRRECAEYEGFWKAWPDEMALKTLCNYAGGREAFPLDETTRLAIQADNETETGGDIARVEMAATVHENANATPISLPAPAATDTVRLVKLDHQTVTQLKATAKGKGVAWADVEMAFGDRIEDIQGEDQDLMTAAVLGAIKDLERQAGEKK